MTIRPRSRLKIDGLYRHRLLSSSVDQGQVPGASRNRPKPIPDVGVDLLRVAKLRTLQTAPIVRLCTIQMEIARNKLVALFGLSFPTMDPTMEQIFPFVFAVSFSY